MSRVTEKEWPEDARDDTRADTVWLDETVAELRKPLTPVVAGQLRAARRTALAEGRVANSVENSGSWQRHWLFNPVPALALGGCALALSVYLLQAPVTENVLTGEHIAGSRSSSKSNGHNGSQSTGSDADQATVLLEDLAIMAAQDELEFYQQLEFIEWLENKGSS